MAIYPCPNRAALVIASAVSLPLFVSIIGGQDVALLLIKFHLFLLVPVLFQADWLRFAKTRVRGGYHGYIISMANPAQIEANRQNAQRSTGPKTAKGKAAAARNALKHGLLSSQVLLPNEQPTVLAELAQRLRAELEPVGELEGLLADRIISLTWRLRRLGKIEAGILALQHYRVLTDRARDRVIRFRGLPEMQKVFSAEQQKHEWERESDLPTCGEVFVRDSGGDNALSKLSRYETMIERSLYKALHELQRLQAARQGKEVPVPVAVDVDVSGESSPKFVEDWQGCVRDFV